MEKLIKRRTLPEESPLYYVSIEDTFDIIKRAHIATGHGGRDRMIKELQRKYANISTKAVEHFKSLCVECQKKRKRPMTKGVVVRPILTKEFGCRGQVDLIDMQAMTHSNYKWIMVYQDHLTKFCVIRPLTTKRASEVAFQLMDIFLLMGAPVILQSDNGSEFTSHVITELKEVWPTLKLVHGKPRHPQSQGSVERANGDIKDMLVAWMADNETQDWATGIKFVQFQKNSAHHSGIKCSPYSAMFGCEARVGLTSSALPTEVIHRMESEDDLLAAFSCSTPPLQETDSMPAASNNPPTVLVAESIPENANIQPTQQETDNIPANPSSLTTQLKADSIPAADLTTQADHEDTVFIIMPPNEISIPDLSHIFPTATATTILEEHTEQIRKRRAEACAAQLSQAERMVKRSRVDLKAGVPGDNVAVPIPAVDRGRGDPRNILGVIINRDVDTDQYKIAVKAGVLKGQYSRNQFDLCPQRLLTEADVSQENATSLRSAVIAESSSGGQGFTKCNCNGQKKCQTNRCKCFKAKLKCNSRCHASLTCANK